MPSELAGPFTEEQVKELYDHIEQAYQPERQVMSKLQDMYWGEQAIKVPDTNDRERTKRYEPERVTTEEAARIADHVESMYVNKAQVSVEWTGESPKSGTAADKVEKALTAIYDRLNPPFGGVRMPVRFDQMYLGKGAQLGIMPGKHYYWDFPTWREGDTERGWRARYEDWRKGGPLPFAYIHLPSESTWPASLGLIDDLCLSVMVMTYWDLQEMFSPAELAGAFEDLRKVKPGETYSLAMASNRDHLVYSLMGAQGAGISGTGFTGGRKNVILRQVRHDMGMSVIRVVPGVTRSRHRTVTGGGLFWLPLLYHVMGQIEYADRLASIAGTAAKEDAFPVLKQWTRQIIEGQGAQGNVNWLPGSDIIQLEMDSEGNKLSDMEALHQPQFGQHTQALLAFILNRIDRITGMTSMLEGQTAEDTAWATNQMVQLATNIRAPLTEAVKRADLQDYRMILRAAELHGHDITIGGEDGNVELAASEAAKWSPVINVDYKLRTPVNQIALWRAGLEMAQVARRERIPIPWDMIAEEVMGFEQPEEMYRRAIRWWAAMDERTFERAYNYWMMEADATLTEETKGMTPETMAERYGRLSPEAQALAQPAYQALQGRAMRGRQRAESPLESAPGGPQPMEMVGIGQ